MGEVRHVVGDATRPAKTADEEVVIAHVVNDAGAWGRGFVVALSRWDDTPERAYRRWCHTGDDLGTPFKLGRVQLVTFGPVADRTYVANLVAQRGWRRGPDEPQALDLDALRTCLRRLWDQLHPAGDEPVARVVMPRVGCGLGGARWADVEPLIQAELVDRGVDVTVYSLPGERWDDQRDTPRD